MKETWKSGFSGIDGSGDDWRYVLGCPMNLSMDFRLSDLVAYRIGLVQLQDGLDIMHRKYEEYVKIMIEK